MSLITQALQKTDESSNAKKEQDKKEELRRPESSSPLISEQEVKSETLSRQPVEEPEQAKVIEVPVKPRLSQEEIERIQITDSQIEKEINEVKSRDEKRKLISWLPWFFIAAVVGAGLAYYVSFQGQQPAFNPRGEEAFIAEKSSRIESATQAEIAADIAVVEEAVQIAPIRLLEEEAVSAPLEEVAPVEDAAIGEDITTTNQTVAEDVTSTEEAGEFVLTGITVIDGDFTAIVNNEIVGKGDMIAKKAYVRDIQKDYVIVEFEGATSVLSMS